MQVVDNESFASQIATERVLLDFYADWCGPCTRIAASLEAIDQNLIPVIKINVDENRGLSEDFSIQSLPTLVVLRWGEEVDRIVGAFPERVIRSKIESALN